MATTPLMIRFSKDDQKVYMHLVQSSNIVDRNDPILPAFDKNFADPVLKGFKIVEVPIIFINRVLGVSKMNSSIFGEALFGVLQLKLWSIGRKSKM